MLDPRTRTGTMGFITDTVYLTGRLYRQTLRLPVFLMISVVQSVLWLLLFGQLFRRVIEVPGFETTSYLQFLAPGIAVMAALFGSIHSGLGMLSDIERGVIDRFLATPARRGALIGARVAHVATMATVQATLILAIATALGARPGGGGAGILVVLLAAALLGSAFGAVSNAVSLLTRRQEIIIASMDFIVLPMIFLSGIMMTPALMPTWIQRVAAVNPVNWAVVAARGGFEGNWVGVGTHLALLAGIALACAWWATRAFDRYRATL